MNLLIFVPAYNEQDSILKVAQDLRTHCPQIDFVVINDGSADRTAQICAENNIPCISLPVNLGLDGVFQTGNKYALQHGYDYAMPFDGDGQHNAKCVQLLIDKMQEGPYAVSYTHLAILTVLIFIERFESRFPKEFLGAVFLRIFSQILD